MAAVEAFSGQASSGAERLLLKWTLRDASSSGSRAMTSKLIYSRGTRYFTVIRSCKFMYTILLLDT